MRMTPFVTAVRPVMVSERPARSKVALSAENASAASTRPPAPAPCGMTSSAPSANTPRRTMIGEPPWLKVEPADGAKVSVPSPPLTSDTPKAPAAVKAPWIEVAPGPSIVQVPGWASSAAVRPAAKVTLLPAATMLRNVRSRTSPDKTTGVDKTKDPSPAKVCVAPSRKRTSPPKARSPPKASIVASPRRTAKADTASEEASRRVPPRTSRPPA